MSIYTDFKPTYLYIKQHTVTGKLYFGKTTYNPEKYLGSGTHWKAHIKKHGKEHVVNLWYCLFYDQKECTEFALNFSIQQNIVESEDWLNQMNENGLDSRSGIKMSDESKRLLSIANLGKSDPPEVRLKKAICNIGRPTSVKQKETASINFKDTVSVFDIETKTFYRIERAIFETLKGVRYFGTASKIARSFIPA